MVARKVEDNIKEIDSTATSQSFLHDGVYDNATESRYILQYCSVDGRWAENYGNYYI